MTSFHVANDRGPLIDTASTNRICRVSHGRQLYGPQLIHNINPLLYLVFCLCGCRWVATDNLWARSWQMPHSGVFAFSSQQCCKSLQVWNCCTFPLQCLIVRLANSLCFHLKCPLLEMRGINHCACLAATCPLCHISLNFLQHGKKAAGPLTLSSLGATVCQPLISIFNELSAMI